MAKVQELYIYLDDSGKLNSNDRVCVYGGLVFLSKKEKDKFLTQYRYIVNEIKCKYCSFPSGCNNKCPEIKNVNVKPNDKRRLLNYIRKYFVAAVIIKNDFIFPNIKDNTAARGRFVDYSLKRLIKELVKSLIKKKLINPNESIKIIISIDQQTTKSNGYYDLRSGIYEELIYGISNYNYGSVFNPILFNSLILDVSYKNSKIDYLIQAADLIAGTIRKSVLDNTEESLEYMNEFVDFKVILPDMKKTTT